MILKNLANRVAIVTGARSCIGAATARQMVNLGMKVVGVSRKLVGTPQWDEEDHTGKMVFVYGDVTQLRDISRILNWTRKEFGRTDVLVNAAGLFHNSSNPATLKKMYETNIIGTLLFSRAAVWEMMANGTTNGHIITISSLVGKQDMRAFSGAYLATHDAVRRLTAVLEAEVKESFLPIQVNNIRTSHRLVSTKPEDYIPIHDIAPEDIARAICHAVSIDHPSSHMTYL
ncbi:farnesol dehydrogenase-like [Cloeon dipterum]|uniref:farnesol dehydrogenase-like n=1 Tax=Cloeon dipterum TaxID=197152 RepID=UPI00321F81E9